MKEAGPNCSTDFDNCRNPWCIAEWCARYELTKLFAKAARDAAQLFSRFENESRFNFEDILCDECLDLVLQFLNFDLCQNDLTLSLAGPYKFSVKGLRCGIGGQE